MQWSEVIDNPYLKNLPFKVELNRYGKVEMTNKVQLYLQTGAEEVWIVWENGPIDYYDKTGKLAESGYGVTIKLPIN